MPVTITLGVWAKFIFNSPNGATARASIVISWIVYLFELDYLIRFSELHSRLRFACAKHRCEHVASPPYLHSVLPGCHLQSIWYRLYRKTVAAFDCRMSPTTSRLMLELSGGVLLELGRCPLWVTSGHPSTSEQCPLSAPKEKLLRATHRSAKCRNLALTCYQRLGL